MGEFCVEHEGEEIPSRFSMENRSKQAIQKSQAQRKNSIISQRNTMGVCGLKSSGSDTLHSRSIKWNFLHSRGHISFSRTASARSLLNSGNAC
jgi:hypothetical protein